MFRMEFRAPRYSHRTRELTLNDVTAFADGAFAMVLRTIPMWDYRGDGPSHFKLRALDEYPARYRFSMCGQDYVPDGGGPDGMDFCEGTLLAFAMGWYRTMQMPIPVLGDMMIAPPLELPTVAPPEERPIVKGIAKEQREEQAAESTHETPPPVVAAGSVPADYNDDPNRNHTEEIKRRMTEGDLAGAKVKPIK